MSAAAILLEASLSDFFRWILARRASAHDKVIPGWADWVSMTVRDVDTVTQQSTVVYMPQFFTQSPKIQVSSIFCCCLCKSHQNFSLLAERHHAVCIIKVGCFLLIFLWIYLLLCDNNQGRCRRECTRKTSQSLANTF